MAALSIGIATSVAAATTTTRLNSTRFRTKISCVGWVSTSSLFSFSSLLCLLRIKHSANFVVHAFKSKTGHFVVRRKDPEGLLGPPQTGHLARTEFKRRLERDAEAREAFERQIREEKERRQALRQSRVVPDTLEELVEYFLDTEAQDIEFEIARMRPRLTEEFFSHLQFEIGQIRFAVSKTQDMEDRLIELEALQKAFQEGIEAYDKMQGELITAKASLTKILTSKDVKATLLEMVERNEINRSLLALLDENIADAHRGNQKQAAEFMEKLRGAVVKYITV